jgi:hypothetical protein
MYKQHSRDHLLVIVAPWWACECLGMRDGRCVLLRGRHNELSVCNPRIREVNLLWVERMSFEFNSSYLTGVKAGPP